MFINKNINILKNNNKNLISINNLKSYNTMKKYETLPFEKNRKKILCIGDHFTAGLEIQSYVKQLKVRIGENYDVYEVGKMK
jgi:hypothetical protein